MDPKRYGIELSTGGNILPALAAYKRLPGMEGATYYYYDIPKNPINEWLVTEHQKRFNAPPDFFTAGGVSFPMAGVAAGTEGEAPRHPKMIAPMEGQGVGKPQGQKGVRQKGPQAPPTTKHF